MRFFIVLALERKADFKNKLVVAFADSLKRVSTQFNVEVEEVESFQEHVLITALLPFDIAPATYAEAVLKECEVVIQNPIFQKDYLVTNVKRPTHDQIASFLGMLPLDRDMRMS
jgi:hypothetical protein